jgi:L-ascorbate metabolism protein UlaG (beta-lactamase superfamily)
MCARYYDGPASDHFDGERFFNRYGPTVDHGLRDVWRWKRRRSAARWPKPVGHGAADHPPGRVAGLRIAMVGHASLLIQAASCNILVDPVWSRRAGPFGVLGPARHQPPGIAFDDLPRIDVVLLTHSHYDHMDMATLRRLWRQDRPRVVAPLGNEVPIRRAAEEIRVETGDWWDRVGLAAGLGMTFCPAIHWSSRFLVDRRRALWCGYVLDTPAGVVYLAGDTAFGSGRLFGEIRRRFGAPLVAVLPIGAYEPRWFMDSQHMNPAEAVDALLESGAGQGLGVHWGTFQLTDEAQDAPLAALAAARAARGVAAERFVAFSPGQVWQPLTSP